MHAMACGIFSKSESSNYYYMHRSCQQLDQESDGDAKMTLRQHVMIILQPILIVYVFLLFTDLICWFNIL
jgi:hypothetical protein